MKLIPVFTEKSASLAKQGKYTFEVDVKATKNQIRSEILKVFGVHVKSVRTIKIAGEDKRNQRGKKIHLAPRKKAVITISDGEKLEIFEEVKK